ncbi:diacylglycerol kinase epsilon isoform X2 [Amblyomma americanum]
MMLSLSLALLSVENFARLSEVTVYLGMLMFIIFLIWRCIKKPPVHEVPAWDITKGHRWSVTDILSRTGYCSVCENLIVDGLFCDCCGICVDHGCRGVADKDFTCKLLSCVGDSINHHWVKGNTSPNSHCAVCTDLCGLEAALADFRCCWCQRTVHTSCMGKLDEVCDLGRHKASLVPPYCVRLRMVGWKGRRHLVVRCVNPPKYLPWSPLIVVANRRSGNNDGEHVLSAFRGILNPAQVVDLNDLPPESGLEWCHLIKDHTCRIVVAGGDGTINWIFTVMDRLKLEPPPPLCVLPLGTGNDFARVFGWGEGYCSSDINVIDVLDSIDQATVESIDRWKIHISPQRRLGFAPPCQEKYMTNYFSVGVDALVTLNFHKTRQSWLYFWKNRLFNKFLYITYGTRDLLEKKCRDLPQKVRLWLDGERKNLDHLEAITVLNIPCWGAGVRPWHMGAGGQLAQPQRYDDGLLEVIGLYSSFHVAQLQVGISEPVRLGQAKEVRLELLERLPVQVDGEPWEQAPATLLITFHCQASVLVNQREVQ